MSRLAGRFLLCASIAVTALEGRADAQYFGANKVRFETPSFRVLTTEHFDVYYYPAEADGARLAARLAERWYARLARVFGHTLRGRQPLIIYASPSAFRQTNIVDGDLGEGTGGVTESLRRRIVLPLAGSLDATDHVIGHELVHAFQFDITTKAESASERRAVRSTPKQLCGCAMRWRARPSRLSRSSATPVISRIAGDTPCGRMWQDGGAKA
jgi:hypothetical protein